MTLRHDFEESKQFVQDDGGAGKFGLMLQRVYIQNSHAADMHKYALIDWCSSGDDGGDVDLTVYEIIVPGYNIVTRKWIC